ncbi:hypothetical protein HPB47_023944 [Ixodes persulcatus]|uniref:Uncharacterized protein n=1 Tax=Ixodes persulcatus TaxID=34615 RepID=A0AC60Q5W7_IXOPE|nr:hypothetical protein HPB47_023944 [Ixodes persulcatus]
MRQRVLELCHDGSGHMELTRTLAKVECRYWWPRMSPTVSRYFESCHTYQLNNRPTTKSVGRPFSIIAMNHVSMCSAESSKHTLNVIDLAIWCIIPANQTRKRKLAALTWLTMLPKPFPLARTVSPPPSQVSPLRIPR